MTELLDEVIDEEGDIPDFLPPELTFDRSIKKR